MIIDNSTYLTLVKSVFKLFLSFYMLGCGIANAQNEKKSKPVKINGSIQLGTSYFASNQEQSFPSFSYVASANATVVTKYVSLPFSLTYSNLNLNVHQPFNQFGMSPTFKWLKVNLGYRNLNFGKYSLNGHSMLGAGFEINRKKWAVGFNYGRLLKATKFDTSSTLLTPINYERRGYALYAKYKFKKGHIGISSLAGKDDPESVENIDRLHEDSNVKVYPGQNQVVEVDFEFPLLSSLTWKANLATSLYTIDLRSPVEVDEQELINQGVPSFLVNNFILNGTTNLFTAAESELQYKSKKGFGLGLQYKRISPDFRSMGVYFFQSDIENYTVNVSSRLLKNKVFLSGSIGRQRDNLTNIKQATSKRIIGSLNASFTEKKYGMDLVFYNYTNSQRPSLQLLADSLKIVQRTNNLSLIPRYIIEKENWMHNLILSVDIAQMLDLNQHLATGTDVREIYTTNIGVNHSLVPKKKKLRLNYGVNYTVLQDELNPKYQTIGGNFSVSNQFIKDKMNLGVNVGLYSSQQNEIKGSIFNLGANANYQLTKKLSSGINVAATFSDNVYLGVKSRNSQFRGDMFLSINLF